MNIPLAVLNRALQALDKSYERLNNPTAADPYLDVVRAKSELRYYVNKIMDQTPVQASEVPKHITEGATA
jgi:hypothetical protein